jgi:hypothetical protein
MFSCREVCVMQSAEAVLDIIRERGSASPEWTTGEPCVGKLTSTVPIVVVGVASHQGRSGEPATGRRGTGGPDVQRSEVCVMQKAATALDAIRKRGDYRAQGRDHWRARCWETN